VIEKMILKKKIYSKVRFKWIKAPESSGRRRP